MLEKIGLPPKPSLRGNAWVVDASHCQRCSSQFTFINRKHHCRRCGGIFCGTCTQQRMSLRGQGDSPVRICEPCKKLEEAARFELRHGYKIRGAKGLSVSSSKRTIKNEDDVLGEILGSEADVSSSSESVSSVKDMELDSVSASPEDLRKQAVEEKSKYKVLKGQGKSGEALKAFKRGKELERQAEALEIALRKDRKRPTSTEPQNKVQTSKAPRKGKDDLSAELKELGWSDDEDKKPVNVSVEGEFSSLLREIPVKTSTNPKKSGGIDKSQVIAIKKKALALKREGKLDEAKEELKRAKVLERELEEQELLGGADESDDELMTLINSIDDDKEDDLLAQYQGGSHHDFDISTVDDIGLVGEFDVTDEDMHDPSMAAALKSLGWSEDPGHHENVVHVQSREERLAEIQTLKREALTLKRGGNATEAMSTLKKAKLLERELEASDTPSHTLAERGTSVKHPPRSRLVIQRELLAVKKKALTLKREGKFNEAEEELKKGEILQNQLEELDNSSKVAAAGKASRNLGNDLPDISMDNDDNDGDVDIKDEELNDPNYLSMLKSLGWNDEDNNPVVSSSSVKPEPVIISQPVRRTKRRSKGEIQRELLGLKRKALTLRRQGNVDEAEEVMNQTKVLEAEMAEIDSVKTDQVKKISTDERDDDVTENDMKDPSLLSTLKNLGWEDAEHKVEPASSSTMEDKTVKSASQDNYDLLGDLISPASSQPVQQQQPSMMDLLSDKQTVALDEPKPTASVQDTSPENSLKQEILSYKRKALALKKEGKISEAKEALLQAKSLEKKLLQGDDTVTVSVTQAPAKEKENSPSSSAPPPKAAMSSRERFKIQQESLSHKRQAMKFRREGKIQEAEAETELAKALEAQLEDASPASKPEAVDGVAVEDFLDPQLLSALKAIGLESSASTTEKTQAAVKPNQAKESNDDIIQERSELEERIKAEKRKAVTLKRSGKQAEALDALRRAKLYEKKLNALDSN